MPVSDEQFKLNGDALQLLRKVAGMRKRDGYPGWYAIDEALLETLGFSTYDQLEAAVDSLWGTRDEELWHKLPPLIYIEKDTSPKRLVMHPNNVETAWSIYKEQWGLDDHS
jgi:hypothetical protein